MARLVLFDIDGTLFDTAQDLCRSVAYACALEGFDSPPLETITKSAGHGLKALTTAHLKAMGYDVGNAQIERITSRAFAHYQDHVVVETTPFPGALECLDRVEAMGFKLAIASNKTGKFGRQILSHFGLEKRFAAEIYGDSHDFRKPDPRALWHPISAAGSTPEAACLVGDSDTDFNAARNAGIPMIAVSFGYMVTPVADLGPDHLIDHFDELDAALRKIFP